MRHTVGSIKLLFVVTIRECVYNIGKRINVVLFVVTIRECVYNIGKRIDVVLFVVTIRECVYNIGKRIYVVLFSENKTKIPYTQSQRGMLSCHFAQILSKKIYKIKIFAILGSNWMQFKWNVTTGNPE